MSRNPGCWSAQPIVDHVGVAQVITASQPEWISPFTGLESGQFPQLVRLVAKRGGDEIADGRPGRQWASPLTDRAQLVATYWRTNLTMRQGHCSVSKLVVNRFASQLRRPLCPFW